MSAFEIFLNATLASKRMELRHRSAFVRDQLTRLQAEVRMIERLLAALRADRISESTETPAEASRRLDRDRQRQSQIRDALGSAQRRVADIRAQKSAGRPTSPMNADRARREVERRQKLDRRETDIRATTSQKVAGIRSKMGR